jgi:hypothetical protein
MTDPPIDRELGEAAQPPDLSPVLTRREGAGRIGRWARLWLSGWRSEPVVYESPLPVPAARERLIEASTSNWSAFMSGGGSGISVIGHVGTRRISVQAVQPNVRNSWRSSVWGRLEAVGSGSRFTGKLGWSPFTKAFSGLWLGLVGGAFLALVGRAVVLASRGEATAEAFLFCLMPLGMMLFFIGLTTWGIWAGRREAAYLRSWLADRLQTAEATRIPGYRPRQDGRSA